MSFGLLRGARRRAPRSGLGPPTPQPVARRGAPDGWLGAPLVARRRAPPAVSRCRSRGLVPVVVAAVVIFTGAMATAGAQGTGGLVNLEHLEHLSQVFEVEGQTLRGVWIYAEPGLLASDPYLLRGAPGEGVTCVDDVARSAIAFLWAARAGFDDAARYARDQLDFVMALQADDGAFHNFVFEDGSINRLGITSRKGSGFWAARALWALAEGMRTFRDDAPYYARLQAAFLRGVAPFASQVSADYGQHYMRFGLESPAWFPGDGSDVASITLLGLSAYLELEPEADDVRTLASRLAEGLTEFQYGTPAEYPFLAHPSAARDPLLWHAWGSRQAQALARASVVLDDEAALESAEAEAGNFFVHLLTSQGPVESMRPAVKAGPQIAFGMDSIASGLFALEDVTGKVVYGELGGLMASWLLGNNEQHEPMYDPTTGRTYDGMEADVVNRNAGAESTITGLLALLQAERSAAGRAALGWRWLSKWDDLSVEIEMGLDFGEPPDIEMDALASGQVTALLGPGAAVTVEAEIDRAGPYRIYALVRDDPWQASATVLLGRERIATLVTEPAASTSDAHYAMMDLGVQELDAGTARFTVQQADDGELRFDALVLRPLVAEKLYGRPGERLLLLKSWSDAEATLDVAERLAAALASVGESVRDSAGDGVGEGVGESELGAPVVRVYDRLANEQAGGATGSATLPPFGFALIGFTTSAAMPQVGVADAAAGEPVAVQWAFESGRFHGVELGELFNNDAFSDPRNPAKGNFDAHSGALGATYPAEHAPDPGAVVPFEGVPVVFPPTDTAANNVALAGQRLAVQAGAYQQLWVLGASEQGNYSATVTFEYADGSREERELALSDWCQLPRYGEATALEFGQRRGANGAIERITCRIYLQKLAVDPSRQLTVISLPDRPTMHIFAITLEEP